MAKIKKAQKGAGLTKVTDSIKPPRPNYDGYRPPYVPSGKNQSKFDEGIQSVKKLYQDGKLKQQRTGGAVKKAQKGASMEDPFARKLPKKVGVLPSMTRIEKEKDTTANSTKKQLLDGFQKGPSSSKRKYKNGGSLSALNASNKRDKGIDPKGAFTKVQKKTLAGAKGKASLTKDKQLGATKMKRGGMMKKK